MSHASEYLCCKCNHLGVFCACSDWHTEYATIRIHHPLPDNGTSAVADIVAREHIVDVTSRRHCAQDHGYPTTQWLLKALRFLGAGSLTFVPAGGDSCAWLSGSFATSLIRFVICDHAWTRRLNHTWCNPYTHELRDELSRVEGFVLFMVLGGIIETIFFNIVSDFRFLILS